MLRAQGYVTVTSDRFSEYDTITCGHCNQIVMVKPGTGSTVYLLPQMDGPIKEEMGAMCRQCMRPVCLKCHDDGRCRPLERQIEQIEARGRMLKAVGIG